VLGNYVKHLMAVVFVGTSMVVGCRRESTSQSRNARPDSAKSRFLDALENEAHGAERSACGQEAAERLRVIEAEIRNHNAEGLRNGCEVFCAFISRPEG